jgi:hypothetical protein
MQSADDSLRDSLVVQINDVISAQLVGFSRILDEARDDVIAHVVILSKGLDKIFYAECWIIPSW